jgi:hypothetical protein
LKDDGAADDGAAGNMRRSDRVVVTLARRMPR